MRWHQPRGDGKEQCQTEQGGQVELEFAAARPRWRLVWVLVHAVNIAEQFPTIGAAQARSELIKSDGKDFRLKVNKALLVPPEMELFKQASATQAVASLHFTGPFHFTAWRFVSHEVGVGVMK